MPFDLNWLLDGRVIICSLSGLLSLQEVQDARLAMTDSFLPAAQPPALHTLFDITNLDDLGFTLQEFLVNPVRSEKSQTQMINLSGWRVYYGNENRMFRFIFSIFHQNEGHKVHWTPTREEALAFLLERDGSLEGLL